ITLQDMHHDWPLLETCIHRAVTHLLASADDSCAVTDPVAQRVSEGSKVFRDPLPAGGVAFARLNPISRLQEALARVVHEFSPLREKPHVRPLGYGRSWPGAGCKDDRSEEHTSELQSRFDLVCRVLL